jgi:hypothetical protein
MVPDSRTETILAPAGNLNTVPLLSSPQLDTIMTTLTGLPLKYMHNIETLRRTQEPRGTLRIRLECSIRRECNNESHYNELNSSYSNCCNAQFVQEWNAKRSTAGKEGATAMIHVEICVATEMCDLCCESYVTWSCSNNMAQRVSCGLQQHI